MNYAYPIYQLSLASEVRRQLVSVFGLDGLLDTIPLLDPETYSVNELGPYGIPYGSVATAAVYDESGRWSLIFGDGRVYSGRTMAANRI